MYRILFVEDDEVLRHMFNDLLKEEGFETFLCPDGKSALAGALEHSPDLLLLDVKLPDIDGFEICRRLKADARTKSIPIIILTGQARETLQRVQGLDLGVEDYLLKPISPSVLISRIRSILKVVLKSGA